MISCSPFFGAESKHLVRPINNVTIPQNISSGIRIISILCIQFLAKTSMEKTTWDSSALYSPRPMAGSDWWLQVPAINNLCVFLQKIDFMWTPTGISSTRRKKYMYISRRCHKLFLKHLFAPAWCVPLPRNWGSWLDTVGSVDLAIGIQVEKSLGFGYIQMCIQKTKHFFPV